MFWHSALLALQLFIQFNCLDMRKIIVIDVVDFYFPTIRSNNSGTGKSNMEERVSDVNEVEEIMRKVGGEKFKAVYITRMDQDFVREKIRRNGFKEGRIYNIHDDLRKGDLSLNMKLIMEYDGVGKEDMLFMSNKMNDLMEVKKMGIKCYGLDGDKK